MVQEIRIRNLRSLTDTGWVAIKPLTILLGANSTGKSTFLRTFPLFCQSISKNLRSPISWFDDSMVDFGDFKTSYNKFAEIDDGLEISLKIVNPEKPHFFFGPFSVSSDIDYDCFNVPSEMTFSIVYKGDENETYVSSMCVEAENTVYHVQCDLDNKKIAISVNDDYYISFEGKIITGKIDNFVPVVFSKAGDSYYPAYDAAKEQLVKSLKSVCDKKLKNYEKFETIIKAFNGDKEHFLEYLKKQKYINSLKRVAKDWDIDNIKFKSIYTNIHHLKLYFLLNLVEYNIVPFYKNSSYIAPIRAEATRYYRNQALQVNDIDAFGRNLPDYIKSLDNVEKRIFDFFCKNTLGITVNVKAKAGHNSIFVKKDEFECNLSDIGFGYSQILPVIAKLWHISSKRNRSRNYINYNFYSLEDRIVAIEQPELHLHPAMQAIIADAMINVIKSKKESTTRLVVETHSQALLNRIAKRIKDGTIDKDVVNVVLFYKKKGENVSTVEQIGFDSNGVLQHWPYGFFDSINNGI